MSIKDSYGKSPDAKNVSDVEEVPGKGVKAVVGGKPILLGNEKLMSYASIEYQFSISFFLVCNDNFCIIRFVI